MAKTKMAETDLSTEQKIKEAARKVFTQKGYHATKTRDIAEEAGINLALLNYYFRSKDKLFDMVLKELVEGLVGSLKGIFNDEETTIKEKFQLIAEKYAQALIANPHIPLFILSELQINPGRLLNHFQIEKLMIRTFLYRQIESEYKSGKITIAPTDLLINFLSMNIFPFAAKPMISAGFGLNEAQYQKMIKFRSEMVAVWMEKMF